MLNRPFSNVARNMSTRKPRSSLEWVKHRQANPFLHTPRGPGLMPYMLITTIAAVNVFELWPRRMNVVLDTSDFCGPRYGGAFEPKEAAEEQ